MALAHPQRPAKVAQPPTVVQPNVQRKAGKVSHPVQKLDPRAAPDVADDTIPTPATTQAQTKKAAGQPIPLSATGRKRQAQRNRAALDDYVRANGSMSVARRTVVVGRSLERLGYTRPQAHDIALDAPLDARMHDDDALTAALQYAGTITPEAAQANPADPSVIGADAIIPMPKQAKVALQAAQDRRSPLKAKFRGLHGGVWDAFDRVRERVAPWMERIADSPVPSGIGGLFALNLLFLCAIVPVNAQGYTRLQLLYLTLLNRTKLPEQHPPAHVPASPVFQGAIGAIAAVEDAATAVNNVAAALGGDVSKAGNLLQDIGSAVGVAAGVAGRVAGIGGAPGAGTTGTGGGDGAAGGDYIPRPPSPSGDIIPRFPGRVQRHGV